ncbi:MAG: hypothetical protein ACI4KF_02365 [Huintestinicola sp.]
MLILSENKVINSENVLAFTINKTSRFITEYEETGYQIRAYHSGYTDEDNNADYITVKSYGINEKRTAETELEMIVNAILLEEKVLDLR